MKNLSGFIKSIRDIMRNDAGINGDAQRIEQIVWMLFLKVYDAKEQEWMMEDSSYQSIIPDGYKWSDWGENKKDALTGGDLLNFVNRIGDGTPKSPKGLFQVLKELEVDESTPIKKSIVKTVFSEANQYMKDGVLLRQVANIIDSLDFSDYEESIAIGDLYENFLKELQSAGSSGEFYTPRALTSFMAKMIHPKLGEKMADFACGTGGFITSWLKELGKNENSALGQEIIQNSFYGIEKKQFPYMLAVTNMLLHDQNNPSITHGNALLKSPIDYTDDEKFDVILMNPPYGGSEKKEVQQNFPDDIASSETADLFMAVIMGRLKEKGRAAVVLPDGFLFGTDNAKINLKKNLLEKFNLHTVIRLPASVFAPYTSITTNVLFFDNTKPTEETWFYRMDMPKGYKHFSKTKPILLEHFKVVEEWWNNREEIVVDEFPKAKKFTAKELSEDLGYNFDQCGVPHIEEEILLPMDLINQYQEKRASLNAKIDSVLAEIISILERKD